MKKNKIQDAKLRPVGWVCPKCGLAVAPYMPACPFCEQDKKAFRKVAGGKESDDGMVKES